MKKLSLILALLLLITVTLTSCFGGEEAPPAPESDELTFVSTSVAPTLIMSSRATGAEMQRIAEFATALGNIFGVTVSTSTDQTEESAVEILIGNTSRPASAYAVSKLTATDEGAVNYIICCHDGDLAIAAVNENSMDLALNYLLTELGKGGSITVKRDFELIVNKTADEVTDEIFAVLKEAELENWESRWDESVAILGADTVDSLKRLYAIFGEDTYTWMANLWDPDTGAFYYANSSRDNYPFLPDVESTYQVINALRASGMFNIYSEYYGVDSTLALQTVLPEEMSAGIVEFVREMQDSSDGYFYHVQWGKNINTSRRGRDIRWATQLLTWLGGTPKYPTALDRLEGSSGVAAEIAEMLRRTEGVSTVGYLDSEAEFIAYLDTLKFSTDSHSAGHSLASQMYEIEAAGLLDTLLDYTDELQRKNYEEMAAAHAADPINNPAPNGLWQKEINYTSVSGLMKLSAVYNLAKRQVNYLPECVASCIESALAYTDPAWVIYIYNPWAALGSVMSLARTANSKAASRGESLPFDLESAYAVIYENAEAMVDKTIEKLAKFRKDDGSYSYYQNQSAPTTQGTYVSLGLDEGDVNATYCAFQTISYIFSAFNITRPAVWNATDLDAFLEIIETSSSIVKNTIDPDTDIDLEDCEIGEIPIGISAASGVDSGTVNDPVRPGNKVYSAVSPLNTKGDTTGIDVYHGLGAVACVDFSMDLLMQECSGGYSHQITFGGRSAGDEVYMITLNVNNKKVTLGDSSSTTSKNTSNSYGTVANIGEWFNLRLKIFATPDAESFRVKIYVNDKCIAISNNFYDSQLADSLPSTNVEYVKLYAMMRVTSVLLVDNIHCHPDTEAIYDESDYGVTDGAPAGSYDFESYNGHFTATQHYPGSYSDIVNDPAGGNNKVYEIYKENGDTGHSPDIYQFAAGSGSGNRFTLTADIYFDGISLTEPSANFRHIYQLAVGDFNNANTVYTLIFVYDASGKIVAGDTNDTAKNNDVNLYSFVFEQNKWYTITLEITLSENPDEFSATLSVDGKEIGSSKNYYDQNSSTRLPSTAANKIDLRPMRRTKGKIYLDDITLVRSN